MPRAPSSKSLPVITAADARRLFMHAQGLLADPAKNATPAAVRRMIEQMGFVQVDTINVLLRAHHHILLTRFDDYQPRTLTKLLEKDRTLFEHWTHDASVIPARWIDHWHHRYPRYVEKLHTNQWFRSRIGNDAERLLDHVRRRVEREGPVRSSDFEHGDGQEPAVASSTRGAKSGGEGWWGWKPQKAALEYLWYTGELAICARQNFQKHYDLMARVFPYHHAADAPPPEATIDWACSSAIERLGVASAAEIARFWNAITKPEAASWCKQAVADGDTVEVLVESADGSKPVLSYALPDWRRRLGRAPDAPDRIRLLSPFDPVVRERERLLRRFNFDYRFEAFVPAKKRKFGYYVLPMLEGDRIVGRADAKHDRKRSTLAVQGLWWEPKVRINRARNAMFEEALERMAAGIGAEHVELPQE